MGCIVLGGLAERLGGLAERVGGAGPSTGIVLGTRRVFLWTRLAWTLLAQELWTLENSKSRTAWALWFHSRSLHAHPQLLATAQRGRRISVGGTERF